MWRRQAISKINEKITQCIIYMYILYCILQNVKNAMKKKYQSILNRVIREGIGEKAVFA